MHVSGVFTGAFFEIYAVLINPSETIMKALIYFPGKAKT